MTTNRNAAFSSLRVGGENTELCAPSGSAANNVPEVIREKVQDGLTGETRELAYTQCKIVGNGSFGVVFQTKLSPSGEDAAIKRVLQDKRFKARLTKYLNTCVCPDVNAVQNRELQIMRIVRHPNIVELKAFYYSNGERVRFVSLHANADTLANTSSHRKTKFT